VKRQTRAVLRLLEVAGSDGVSPAEARRAVGTDRLAARVWELRRLHGYHIERVMERAENGDTYGRYYLRAGLAQPLRGEQEALALA
jgi:hypothetical protein